MKYLKIFSIVSYSLIMLIGMMIPFPFIFLLIFTLFDFGNIDQLFAFLGIAGMILAFVKSKYEMWISFLSFILMTSAIENWLKYASIKDLNYLAFIIPFSIFILTQMIIIFSNVRKALNKLS